MGSAPPSGCLSSAAEEIAPTEASTSRPPVGLASRRGLRDSAKSSVSAAASASAAEEARGRRIGVYVVLAELLLFMPRFCLAFLLAPAAEALRFFVAVPAFLRPLVFFSGINSHFRFLSRMKANATKC